MADPLVTFDDLEMFLTTWYRVHLAARPEAVCADVEVDRVEPAADDDWPDKLLVIRDDGMNDESVVTGEASVGLSVLMGSKQSPHDAKSLARIVYALGSQIPDGSPGNPVAAVRSRTGPYLIPETQPRARVYMTFTLAVAGRPL